MAATRCSPSIQQPQQQQATDVRTELRAPKAFTYLLKRRFRSFSCCFLLLQKSLAFAMFPNVSLYTPTCFDYMEWYLATTVFRIMAFFVPDPLLEPVLALYTSIFLKPVHTFVTKPVRKLGLPPSVLRMILKHIVPRVICFNHMRFAPFLRHLTVLIPAAEKIARLA